MIESKYLKDTMQNIQRLLEIPALKNFEVKNLAKLLRLSKIREYEDGEYIIKEGDNDPWLYFLLNGKVRITKDGFEIGAIDKKGEIFGEMRIIDSLARSASVIANGRAVCLAVDTSVKEQVALDSKDERADFLFLLYKIFAEYMSMRLRVTSIELAKTKKALADLKGEEPDEIYQELSDEQLASSLIIENNNKR